MPLNIAVAKPALNDEDAERVRRFVAKGGKVTHIDANVSLGMKRTDYLPRRSGGGGKGAEKLNTGDVKFDMYLNALPGELRAWAVATGADVRAMYKEYRTLKKDGLLEKYMPVVEAWKAE